MATVEPLMSRQEQVARRAGATAARVMGQMNVLSWQLVEMLVEVLDADGWCPGGGLKSPEHWLCWRTGLSRGRAARLVQIARRVDELPECIKLFREGRLSEDAMALIAKKAPPHRDSELAEVAPLLLYSQLNRVLKALPEQERSPVPKPDPVTRQVRFGFDDDGLWRGTFVLPPDEGAIAQKAMESSRAELFAERQADDDPSVRGPVCWADSFVRACEHALDSLDPATRRGEARGPRAQVVVHLDARSDGDGQARIHLGPQLPASLRRYLCCDAKVRAAIEDDQRGLIGISPLAPTVGPQLRTVIEQRDGGCRYPGCSQARWVHVHHIQHREDGGATVASNLCCLCPFHHRLHHQGGFEIEGDPEAPGGLRFSDRWGHAIGPPRYGPVAPPLVRDEVSFKPPTGEILHSEWFTWN